ncbi:hypothetical protein EWM64_g3404 [Hericium alpestre]|uniref:Ribosomal protein S5 domain 2-like protein n=1 Tax=Hericium alpestre TaxID=135208 RepID=A0A4Z0A2R8_9AGAM|nr:hypothetical protein EWM64_g3404 [Hericium alpestre]
MLNAFRQPVRVALKRQYATASTPFVPPRSLQHVDRTPRRPEKVKPESPTFYTGRSDYYDQVNELETAVTHSRRALRTLELLPLPKHARDSLPPAQPAWRSRDDMSSLFARRLTTSRYRRLTELLSELESHQRIASTAGHPGLAGGISGVMRIFERADKDAFLGRGKAKPVKFDRFGRSYTVGRRKESTAQVWMIPVQAPAEKADVQESLPDYSLEPRVQDAFEHTQATRVPVNVTTTSILVNNIPLNEYFPSPADCERIIRPLKLAGVVGAYNVFAIVRGGGTTGQSGAVAHGVAKGVVAHVPEVEQILRKAKIFKRDPRMVERKKTGLAKARKRYAWVKR